MPIISQFKNILLLILSLQTKAKWCFYLSNFQLFHFNCVVPNLLIPLFCLQIVRLFWIPPLFHHLILSVYFWSHVFLMLLKRLQVALNFISKCQINCWIIYLSLCWEIQALWNLQSVCMWTALLNFYRSLMMHQLLLLAQAHYFNYLEVCLKFPYLAKKSYSIILTQ